MIAQDKPYLKSTIHNVLTNKKNATKKLSKGNKLYVSQRPFLLNVSTHLASDADMLSPCFVQQNTDIC